jgi:hypothetical protein
MIQQAQSAVPIGASRPGMHSLTKTYLLLFTNFHSLLNSSILLNVPEALQPELELQEKFKGSDDHVTKCV